MHIQIKCASDSVRARVRDERKHIKLEKFITSILLVSIKHFGDGRLQKIQLSFHNYQAQASFDDLLLFTSWSNGLYLH